ncbi:hypothetical protein MVEN_01510000 [Mycena venus]|uniref:Uncharacterized protein n=1 Tax=Mycena venus TaxID=2733690 RepID=A0A8H6XVW1_9AGAR|nr:hypothetical protein MVEN_01510000 [Mycena venus]
MHDFVNPNMTSTQQSFGFGQASTSMSETTDDRVSRLQAKLNQKLGPEFISAGPGDAPKLTYTEGWKVINVANEVFGFEGWSSNIVSLTTDYMDCDEETRGTTPKSGGDRRAKIHPPTFGNVLGNCLYDKQYTSEIVKIKVPPIKFDKGDLYRLSHKPPAASASTSTSASRSITATPTSVHAFAPPPAPQQQKWQSQPQQHPVKSISSVPRHIQPTGLQTSITTLAGEPKVSAALQVKAEPQTKPPQGQIQSSLPPPSAVPVGDDAEDALFGFSDDGASGGASGSMGPRSEKAPDLAAGTKKRFPT